MLIKTADFKTSAPSLALCPASGMREFAFIGRSNVGKSSLLNMLTGRKALAKVSATPGHTQLINFFTINNAWTLVDLPGYGYAKMPKSARRGFIEMVTDYLEKRPNIACVFVLVDSRLEPQEIDLEFIEWLVSCDVPLALVFTKADKLKDQHIERNMADFLTKLKDWVEGEPDIFITSSEDKTGRTELLNFIQKTLAEE